LKKKQFTDLHAIQKHPLNLSSSKVDDCPLNRILLYIGNSCSRELSTRNEHMRTHTHAHSFRVRKSFQMSVSSKRLTWLSSCPASGHSVLRHISPLLLISVRPFVYLSVYMSVYLRQSTCQFTCQSTCQSISLSFCCLSARGAWVALW